METVAVLREKLKTAYEEEEFFLETKEFFGFKREIRGASVKVWK